VPPTVHQGGEERLRLQIERLQFLAEGAEHGVT